MWIRPRLSTARQIFAVDPKPFGDSRNGGGALSSFLLARYLEVHTSPRLLRFFSHEVDAILVTHEQDHSFTRTDLYVQLFRIFLEEMHPNYCAVASWLAMELEEKDLSFLGMEVWRAAVGRLCSPSYHEEREACGHTYKGEGDESLRVIRTLFSKREIFGIDITQLHRFLHQESRGGWKWVAETLVREEPACVLAENNDAGQGFGHLSGRPLNHAAKRSLPTLFALMLSAGADPNEQDENGNTTIFFAISSAKPPQPEKIIESLLELGRNINHQNHMGLTPLAYAMSRGMWSGSIVSRILQLLLKNGYNMNTGEFAGRTPLMRGIAHDDFEAIAALLDEGCDINVQDNEPGTSPGYSMRTKSSKFWRIMRVVVGILYLN